MCPAAANSPANHQANTGLNALNLGGLRQPGQQPANPPLASTQLETIINRYLSDADKYQTQSPRGAITLIEVTSALQLPIILDKLQKSPENIRLTFPDMCNSEILAEQTKIHTLLSERHSKDLGNIVTESKKLIENCYHFKNHTQADKAYAEKYLAGRANPSANSTVILNVDQFISIPTTAKNAHKPLVDQLVQGLGQGSVRGNYIVELPRDERIAREVCTELETSLGKNQPAAANISIAKAWIGTNQKWERTSPPPVPPTIEQMDLDDLRKKARGGTPIFTPPAQQQNQQGGQVQQQAQAQQPAAQQAQAQQPAAQQAQVQQPAAQNTAATNHASATPPPARRWLQRFIDLIASDGPFWGPILYGGQARQQHHQQQQQQPQVNP